MPSLSRKGRSLSILNRKSVHQICLMCLTPVLEGGNITEAYRWQWLSYTHPRSSRCNWARTLWVIEKNIHFFCGRQVLLNQRCRSIPDIFQLHVLPMLVRVLYRCMIRAYVGYPYFKGTPFLFCKKSTAMWPWKLSQITIMQQSFKTPQQSTLDCIVLKAAS